MDELQVRLVRCFAAVFPSLPSDRMATAQSSSVEGWDSVASVTLLAMVEEEFGIEIDVQGMEELLSFEKLLAYLRQKLGKSR
jgi:acyl carrier protein